MLNLFNIMQDFNKQKKLVLDFAINKVNYNIISSHIDESEYNMLMEMLDSGFSYDFLWEYIYTLDPTINTYESNITQIYNGAFKRYTTDLISEYELDIYTTKIHNLFKFHEKNVLYFIEMYYPYEILTKYLATDYLIDKKNDLNYNDFIRNINKIFIIKLYNLNEDLFTSNLSSVKCNLGKYLFKLVKEISLQIPILDEISIKDVKELKFNRDDIIDDIKIINKNISVSSFMFELLGESELRDIFIKYNITSEDINKILLNIKKEN